MIRQKADLHTHTTCSDGNVSPNDLVQMASNLGLDTLAITDHDTFEGYLQAREKAEELNINLISGVEVTTSFKGRESHILAYDFNEENSGMHELMANHRRIRKTRIKRIISKVIKNGFDITYDEVRAEANSANMGRPHIAAVLKQKGYVVSVSEAFMKYLNNDALGEDHNEYVDWKDALDIIKSAGGACVVAHPGFLYNDEEIKLFIDGGIDGLECIHPSHRYDQQKKYADICEKHFLIQTGGSDFHGTDRETNKHFGTVTISGKYVTKLKRLTDQRKALN